MNNLTEQDIRTKYITPAILKAGWDIQTQLMEEVSFTDGKIYVKGKLTCRGEKKRADYILYYKSNIPIAIVEAKDANHSVSDGIQQALEYSKILDIPFVFSSNGTGFYFHDKTAIGKEVERTLALNSFPSPDVLWNKYKAYKGLQRPAVEKIVEQDYYPDSFDRKPRYYQQIAINRTIEAIAKGEKRVLLVMATGTGKTYTAFQIAYRLWKAGAKKRILFLADRTALIDQARRNDFRYFRDKMTVIKKKVVETQGKETLVSTHKRGIDSADKAYEVFLGLYQGLSSTDDNIKDAYKDFSSDFFDLVIVDECHRGSAKDDSAWREILTYFSNATHIGLTATPKETDETSNSKYFGEPIYTYSLRQGIDDGFLAPYKVVRIGLNVDLDGWRPPKGYLDKDGNPVEDRIYNRKDFDRTIVIDERRKLVAKKITEFLRGGTRYEKTIVFCVDIEHAREMRNELVKVNDDLVRENDKYVMQITGDDNAGKRQLDNFINPEEKWPVIATTSKLMTTGIDAQTCKVIVLDSNIQSITEFKQIIGRGTRINEDFGKRYFTILDFRNVTDLFADKEFDGEPVKIKAVQQEDDISTVDSETNTEEILYDDVSGKEVVFEKAKVKDAQSASNGKAGEKRKKVYVNGVDVSELLRREIYFDENGKPITSSLKDFTKQKIEHSFKSLDEFLQRWNGADRKEALMEELKQQGILVDELQEAVNKDLDLFDIICHVAFDKPPLTRRERAENVKKRNYFTKYGEQTRIVLEKLLEKYASEGIENLESMEVLKVPPFDEIGSVTQIIGLFGNKEKYLTAVKELEQQLYSSAA
jgi:type I restriction enzyme R subunit